MQKVRISIGKVISNSIFKFEQLTAIGEAQKKNKKEDEIEPVNTTKPALCRQLYDIVLMSHRELREDEKQNFIESY